jgi:hypothetical protein
MLPHNHKNILHKIIKILNFYEKLIINTKKNKNKKERKNKNQGFSLFSCFLIFDFFLRFCFI